MAGAINEATSLLKESQKQIAAALLPPRCHGVGFETQPLFLTENVAENLFQGANDRETLPRRYFLSDTME